MCNHGVHWDLLLTWFLIVLTWEIIHILWESISSSIECDNTCQQDYWRSKGNSSVKRLAISMEPGTIVMMITLSPVYSTSSHLLGTWVMAFQLLSSLPPSLPFNSPSKPGPEQLFKFTLLLKNHPAFSFPNKVHHSRQPQTETQTTFLTYFLFPK